MAGEPYANQVFLWNDKRKNDKVDARRIATYAFRFLIK